MMTALWIVLGLAAVCLLGGCAAVLACSRGQHATEAEIDAYLKPYPIHDEAMAAQRFVLEQEPEQLFVESYDGKRLHAQLLRTENAAGTILLFHGYRSSWNVDFSASLLFYRSLDYNLLLVDQRAHQDSEGTFLTFGAKERYDVISWVTYLGQMLGQTHPLFLGGLSMGATTDSGAVRAVLGESGDASARGLWPARGGHAAERRGEPVSDFVHPRHGG